MDRPLPPLQSRRLTMRPFTQGDAPFIVELLNDPGWLRFIGDRGVRTDDDARAYLNERVLAHEAQHGFALRGVALQGGTLVGMCGLLRRETLPDVDLGYAFLPAYRGQGYAREAAAAWLAHGFGALGLERIVAFTDPDNAASCRVLEAIGMRFEKRFRIEGYEGDSLLYAADPSTSSG